MTDQKRRLGGRASGLILMLVAATALSGCLSRGGDDLQAQAETSEPPDVLYNRALASLNAGSSKQALEAFESVDEQHPYTDYARRATLMNAYLNFRRGEYDDAVNAAKRYVTLYPRSEDAAYAQYLIGESYYRRIPDITRDQELSQRAEKAMRELVEKYPDSEYANDARKKLRVAEDQIAGKEMQVGRYYLERRNYAAALSRFRTVVNDHQRTRHVEEALHRLTETYLALGVVPEARTAAAVLGHNFPDSSWYKDSYRLLQAGGTTPEESRGSWISRAFRSDAASL